MKVFFFVSLFFVFFLLYVIVIVINHPRTDLHNYLTHISLSEVENPNSGITAEFMLRLF